MSTDMHAHIMGAYIHKIADALLQKRWLFHCVAQRKGAGLPWLINDTASMPGARDKKGCGPGMDAVVVFGQAHALLYFAAEVPGKDRYPAYEPPPEPLHPPVVVSLATAARKLRQRVAVAREIDRELRSLEEVEALSGIEALR